MTTTQHTEASIKKMTLPLLRELAAEHFEADDLKGLKKAQFIDLLIENLDTINGASDDEELDDDEVEDDGVDDEVDDEELPATDSGELDATYDEEDELDDEEEFDEVVTAVDKAVDKAKADGKLKPAKSAPPEPQGETLTAKQVATRIGTDAKTLRKFFRSGQSTIEPVGQGGRYEFAKDDLPKIKAEFEKFQSGKTTRTPRAKSGEAEAPKRRVVEVEEIDDELDDSLLDDPTDEDLELEDDELED